MNIVTKFDRPTRLDMNEFLKACAVDEYLVFVAIYLTRASKKVVMTTNNIVVIVFICSTLAMKFLEDEPDSDKSMTELFGLDCLDFQRLQFDFFHRILNDRLYVREEEYTQMKQSLLRRSSIQKRSSQLLWGIRPTRFCSELRNWFKLIASY